ncbi:MAG: NnrS family protein [Microvirga sp.]|nr:NnrS family protein [Microvirga sp.]
MSVIGQLPDRSVPRSRIRQGDRSRDGRGRIRSAPAILHYGFRPFFLLGALHAAFLIPIWLLMLISGREPGGPFDALQWHAHEMIFGYLAAVVAGFVLTAVPNWTGGLPLSGAPLAGLVALWAAGRLATGLLAEPVAAALIDVSFLTVLAACVWREIVAGRNWRNAPVALMLSLLAMAGLLHHLEAAGYGEPGLAIRLALGGIMVLLALIGGRIVPSFTRNWLARQVGQRLPASFGLLDKAALTVTLAAVAAWIIKPHEELTAGLLIIAGVMLVLRLSRWRSLATLREPIVGILHLGYGWLAVAPVLMGAAILWPGHLAVSPALHALTAGAAGTMTLAVMTRASLGHTGREIVADRWTMVSYCCVSTGAFLRVAADLAGPYQLLMLSAGGLVWSLAFLVFAIRYVPILARPRL